MWLQKRLYDVLRSAAARNHHGVGARTSEQLLFFQCFQDSLTGFKSWNVLHHKKKFLKRYIICHMSKNGCSAFFPPFPITKVLTNQESKSYLKIRHNIRHSPLLIKNSEFWKPMSLSHFIVILVMTRGYLDHTCQFSKYTCGLGALQTFHFCLH